MSLDDSKTRRESDRAYYARLGGLIEEGCEPDMRMSQACQICRTWRMHFGWRLARALGWGSRDTVRLHDTSANKTCKNSWRAPYRE
jgi:hypothetical protein